MKWIPFVGWIITAVEGLIHAFFNLRKEQEKFGEVFGNGTIGGIVAVGYEIVRALTGPFAIALDIIMDKWCGKSPSKLGLGIVNGLKSVGGMIFESLLSPFKLWYRALTGIWKNVLTLIKDSTPSWVKSLFVDSEKTPSIRVEDKFKSEFDLSKYDNKSVDSEQFTKSTEDYNKNQSTYHEQFDKMIETNKNNNDVINKLNDSLNVLIELLSEGNIGISVDGTRLNYELRNSESLFGKFGRVSKI